MRPTARASARSQRDREGSSAAGIFDVVRVRATRLASNVRALLVSFAGHGGSDDTDDEQEQVADSELLSPLGFIARPRANDNTASNVEAVVVRDGDESLVLYIVNKSLSKLSNSELAEGETLMHGASAANVTARIKINASGDVEINTVSNRKVIVNGGNKPVAHEGSATTGHTHTVSGTAGPYAFTATTASSTDTIATGQGSADVHVRDT